LSGWNNTLINNIFFVTEAKIIKGIPICPSLPPNKIIWNGTSSGIFSVKSAYHLGMDMLRRLEGECSSRFDRSDFW